VQIGEWLRSDATQRCAFEVELSRSAGMPQERVRDIVANAIRRSYLNVDVYVETLNKLHEWCRRNAGSSEVWLPELFDSRQAPIKLELKVRMTDDDRYAVKSCVVLRASGPITVDGTPLLVYTDATRDDAALKLRALLARQKANRITALKRYMYSCHYLFTRLPSSFEATQRINCFLMKLRSGVALPALAYLMQQEPPTVDPAYFERSLDMVLRREHLTRAQFAELTDYDRRTCNIMMQTLCMYSNWAMYISDEGYLRECYRDGRRSTLKLRDLEEFELVELYDADDCEGVGAKVIRDSHYLLDLREDQCSPELAKVRRVRSQFWMFLMLCGVTTGDIAGDVQALTGNGVELGAHMYCVAVPMRRAFEMIQNCNRAQPVFGSLPVDAEMLLSADEQRLLPPALFGEGTGLLAPLPIELPKHKRLVLPMSVEDSQQHGVALQRLLDSAGTMRDVCVQRLVDKSSAFLFNANAGCAVQECTGSANMALSNNALWLTDVMRAVNPQAVVGVRTWYHWCQSKYGDTSHFYRTFQIAFTADAMRLGYSVGSFAVVRRETPDARWTVGCTLPDFVASNNDGGASELVGLWAEPELSDSEATYVRKELFDAPAVPPILPAPDRAGESNITWDRSAMVPSEAQYLAIHDTLTSLHTTSARATLEAMLCIATNPLGRGAESQELDTRILGVPHLDAKCTCAQYAAAVLLVQNDAELRERIARVVALPAASGARRLLEAFVERFVALYCRNDRLPITPALGINRQQIQRKERIDALHRLASTVMHVRCGVDEDSPLVVVIPGGLHVDPEQVTASTGGYYTTWYSMVV
jgi:hypothetical protein